MATFGTMTTYPSPCQWDDMLNCSSYGELLTTPYYPSPTVSPCMSDIHYGTTSCASDLLSSYPGSMSMVLPITSHVNSSSTMMVPPLQDMGLFPPSIEQVDQFIKHHEYILSASSSPIMATATPPMQSSLSSTSLLTSSTISTPSPQPSPKEIKSKGRPNTTIRPRQKRQSTKNNNSNSNSNSKNLPIQYNCQHPGCGKIFSRPYNLQSHMRTHTTDKPFGCTSCGRRFARQHDRNRHERLHWGIKPYSCSHCSKSFARMDALNRHLRVENGCRDQL